MSTPSNFEEPGDYLVAMNQYMDAFSKIVRRGKEDIAREYKEVDQVHQAND